MMMQFMMLILLCLLPLVKLVDAYEFGFSTNNQSQGGSVDLHSCPQSNYCMGKTSQVADLICYSYIHESGLDYVLTGFGNGVVVFSVAYYDCQPGKVANMRIRAVLGYFIKLKYRYKMENGTYEYGSNVWFIDDTSPGCPQFYDLQPENRSRSIGGSLPLSDSQAYFLYEQIYETRACECNVFPEMPSTTRRRYSGKAPYFAENPLTVIGLQNTKCGYAVTINNDSALVKYVNDYEVPGVEVEQVPGSAPRRIEEIVTVRGFEKTPHCRDFTDTMSVSDVLSTYDYYVDFLDKYSFNKVVRLYAQGPNPNNCNNGQSNCVRNTGGITSFCSVVFIPNLTQKIKSGTPSSPNFDGIISWQLSGFCQNSIKQALLKYFSF